MTPLWKSEFGAAYDVPDVIAKHPRLVDVSYHNDTSPSFMDARTNPDADGPRLWCEHPDPARREFEDYGRFCVSGDPNDPMEYSGAKGNYYEGDDPVAAVAALLALHDRLTPPPSRWANPPRPWRARAQARARLPPRRPGPCHVRRHTSPSSSARTARPRYSASCGTIALPNASSCLRRWRGGGAARVPPTSPESP